VLVAAPSVSLAARLIVPSRFGIGSAAGSEPGWTGFLGRDPAGVPCWPAAFTRSRIDCGSSQLTVTSVHEIPARGRPDEQTEVAQSVAMALVSGPRNPAGLPMHRRGRTQALQSRSSRRRAAHAARRRRRGWPCDSS
jgi:hypothetical protein